MSDSAAGSPWTAAHCAHDPATPRTEDINMSVSQTAHVSRSADGSPSTDAHCAHDPATPRTKGTNADKQGWDGKGAREGNRQTENDRVAEKETQ